MWHAQPGVDFGVRDGDCSRVRRLAQLVEGRLRLRRLSPYATASCGTPFWASRVDSSPVWYISVMMSQPPTNSPFT